MIRKNNFMAIFRYYYYVKHVYIRQNCMNSKFDVSLQATVTLFFQRCQTSSRKLRDSAGFEVEYSESCA